MSHSTKDWNAVKAIALQSKSAKEKLHSKLNRCDDDLESFSKDVVRYRNTYKKLKIYTPKQKTILSKHLHFKKLDFFLLYVAYQETYAKILSWKMYLSMWTMIATSKKMTKQKAALKKSLGETKKKYNIVELRGGCIFAILAAIAEAIEAAAAAIAAAITAAAVAAAEAAVAAAAEITAASIAKAVLTGFISAAAGEAVKAIADHIKYKNKAEAAAGVKTLIQQQFEIKRAARWKEVEAQINARNEKLEAIRKKEEAGGDSEGEEGDDDKPASNATTMNNFNNRPSAHFSS